VCIRCASYCHERGFGLAGVENGHQCFCGNQLRIDAQRAPDADCRKDACSGGPGGCGGGWRIGVYTFNCTGEPLARPSVISQDSLFSIRESLSPLLEGPLPIPSVDSFMAVGLNLRANLSPAAYANLISFNNLGRQFGNVLTLGTLHVTPASPAVDDFLRFARNRHALLRNFTIKVHPSEQAAVSYVLDHEAVERAWAVLVFYSLPEAAELPQSSTARPAPSLRYAIRMNYSTVPNTNWLENSIGQGLDATYQTYYMSGFLTLQALVDEYAFNASGATSAGATIPPPAVLAGSPASRAVAVPFPTLAYAQNDFYLAIGFLLGLVLTMCFLLPVAQFTKAIVEEKELRLKQTMRMMGLRESSFVTSWCLLGLLDATLITISLTPMLRLFIVHANLGLLVAYVGLFSLGSFALSLLLSTFFSNGKLAAVAAPVVFIGTVLPKYIFFGSNSFEQSSAKVLTSLLLPSAFAFGADILAEYEHAERSVTIEPSTRDSYTFGTCLGMMALDCLLYFLLFLYFERALPSKFGASEHPCFCLLPRWWRTGSSHTQMVTVGVPTEGASADSRDASQCIAFEPMADEVRKLPSIEIVHLTKRYGSGPYSKLAVDDLSLSMASEQITCVLGHNGAGKTSTLSVLCGLYPASSGDCIVFGHSISTSRRQVYQCLGVCPQHDVIWPELTVLEHLHLYAELKGLKPAEARKAALEVADDVGLGAKVHARSRALSGGMKRKLSVGCALIGGSTAVLLDEPSSGMDPGARRSMWELLQRNKKGRALVLTTHYMDEADMLADRIAIMSAGKVRCCGSALFLKSRFGLGYTLTMIKANTKVYAQEVARKLQSFVSRIELLSEAGDELSFRLPLDAAPQFAALLRYLDAAAEELGLRGHGMSISSLEEVFIELAKREEASVQGGGPDRHLGGMEAAIEAAFGRDVALKARYARRRLFRTGRFRALIDEEATSTSSGEKGGGGGPSEGVEMQAVMPTGPSSPDKSSGVSMVEVAIDDDPVMSPPEKNGAAAKMEKNEGAVRKRTAKFGSPGSQSPSTNRQHKWAEWRKGGKGASGAGKFAVLVADVVAWLKTLRLMLWKRMCCTRRDLKTLATQQLMPIGLVCLGLLVLVINVPLAGPRIQMNAALLGGGAISELVTNLPAASPLTRQMSSQVLSPKCMDVADSDGLSEYLKHTLLGHGKVPRMGALAVDDELRARVLSGGTLPYLFKPLVAQGASAVVFFCALNGLATATLRSAERSANATPTGAGSRRMLQAGIPLPLPPDYPIAPWLLLWNVVQPQIAAQAQASLQAAADASQAFNNALGASSGDGASTSPWLTALCEASGRAIGIADAGTDDVSLESDVVGNIRVDDQPLASVLIELVAEVVFSSIAPDGFQIFPITRERVNTLANISGVPAFVVALAFSDPRLLAIENGQTVRLTELEGTVWQVGGAPNSIDTGFATAAGPNLFLASPTIQMQEIYVRQNSTTINGIRFTALAQIGNTSNVSSLPVTANISSFFMSRSTMSFSGVEIAVGDVHTGRGNYEYTISDDTAIPAERPHNVSMSWPLTILHNTSSWHALPSYLAEVTAARWRQIHGAPPPPTAGSSPAEESYAVYNHPLPLTGTQELTIKLILATLAALFVLIPFCYIPASAAVFVVKERAVKAKHLQLVSGAGPAVYWLASYLWDLTLFTFTASCCMLVFFCYGEPGYVGNSDQALATYLVLLGYGASVLPMIYCFSFLFESHSTAQIATLMLNLATGFAAVIAHVIMSRIDKAQDIDQRLLLVYRMFPTYVVGEALLGLTRTWYTNALGGCLGGCLSVWDDDAAGRALRFFPLHALGYWSLLLLLEHQRAIAGRLETPRIRRIVGLVAGCVLGGGSANGIGGAGFSSGPSKMLTAAVLIVTVCLVVGAPLDMLSALALLPIALVLAIVYERFLRWRGAKSDLSRATGAGLTPDDPDVVAECARVEAIVATIAAARSESAEDAYQRSMSRASRTSTADTEEADGADAEVPALLIHHLRKAYAARGGAPPKVAVADLSFAVGHHECFGLLGANGAGKTSTMAMLTGDILPSSGEARICGYNVVRELEQVRQRLGYCPQFDPLLELMTGRETLWMFARLKRIPAHEAGPLITQLLQQVSLTPHADKPSGAYSGGNKRKLSLAVALIGAPPVVFLDEPSSGMDPVARRRMWDVLTRERQHRAIILTSHSMEECEALCTRIGIMSLGHMRCIGGQQHLKSRFGNELSLEVRVAEEGGEDNGTGAANGTVANPPSLERASHVEATKTKIMSLFPGAKVADYHRQVIKFRIPSDRHGFPEVFEALEKNKAALGIQDYACSQPRLEEIFLSVAAEHNPENA